MIAPGFLGRGYLRGRPPLAPSLGPTWRWPRTANELQQAFGSGTWANAWQCNEASGNLADSIGSETLTAANSPLYRRAGALDGDLAVGVDAGSADRFEASASTVFDLDETESFALYLCLRGVVLGSDYGAGKIGTAYYALAPRAALVRAAISDGVTTALADISIDHGDGAWHDVLMYIDRTDQVLQVRTDLGVSAAVSISGVGTLSNAGKFAIGSPSGFTTAGYDLAFAAVATGDVVNTLRLASASVIANVRRWTGRP